VVRWCRVRSTRLTGRASSRAGGSGPAPLRRGWKSCWRSLEGGILAADFAGVVPARRGAHWRPLHPRLASLCPVQTLVHACRIIPRNGANDACSGCCSSEVGGRFLA